MRNGGWIVWNSACWLAQMRRGEVCVCVCVCVCVGCSALRCDSSVSGWSARLWRNGLPELPLRCPLTEHVAVCECVFAACVSVCVCVFACVSGGHTCTGNAMALNRVSQLCHDITRLWLQLKMMTGRVCVCVCVCVCVTEWAKEDKTVNVSVMCVCVVCICSSSVWISFIEWDETWEFCRCFPAVCVCVCVCVCVRACMHAVQTLTLKKVSCSSYRG